MAQPNKKTRTIKRSFDPQKIDVATLMQLYAPDGNGLFIDWSFQRRNTAWSRERQIEFICSILKGSQSAALVYADIASGIASEPRAGTGRASYIKSSEKGVNAFISLDGLQRTTALVSFMSGEFGITGEFTDAWDALHVLENVYYHKLPDPLRMTFDMSDVIIHVHKHYRYSALPQLFRDLNAGPELNNMESRNSYQTPVASFIRYMSETPEAANLWNNLQGVVKVGRMEDADKLCALALYTIGDYSYPKKAKLINVKPIESVKDTLYSIGDGYLDFGSTSPYIEFEMYRFRMIFEITLRVLQTQTCNAKWNKKAGLPVWAFNAMFFFVKELVSRNLMVGNSLYSVDVTNADNVTSRIDAWWNAMKSDSLTEYGEIMKSYNKERENNVSAKRQGLITEEQLNDFDERAPKENKYFHKYNKYLSGVANRRRFENDIRALVDEMIADNSVAFFDVEKDIDLYVNGSTLEGMKTVLQVA
jgi:hypothetical protein